MDTWFAAARLTVAFVCQSGDYELAHTLLWILGSAGIALAVERGLAKSDSLVSSLADSDLQLLRGFASRSSHV